MKMKMDDVLIYKDSQDSIRYGTGVVTSITPDEYTVLWSGRGLTKYKRSILDGKLEQVFQLVEKRAGLPKERHLQLGASKVKVAFNDNYDRTKLVSLCEKLKLSGSSKAKMWQMAWQQSYLRRSLLCGVPPKLSYLNLLNYVRLGIQPSVMKRRI